MNSRTRAAAYAFPSEEENERRQRRRIEDELVEGAPAVSAAAESLSLMDLNDNVLVNVMSFLSFIDLNEIAFCSQRCREIRAHESLDQTRVGTIVFSENTTKESFQNAILENDWDEVFSGNRTHLKVVGLENVQGQNWIDVRHREARAGCRLPGVLKLDVSCSSQEELIGRGEVALDASIYALETVLGVLPSLRDMNASYLNSDRSRLYIGPAMCANLERLTWKGCSYIWLSGNGLEHCSSLTELNLNDYHVDFGGMKDNLVRWYSAPDDDGTYWYMWRHCRHLKRLSMKNATFFGNGMSAPEPVTQEMLIKMVRGHPTLRWLRSDLTEENVAMLTEARPDITFVTD